jgi:DNA repair photolyase
MKASTFSLPLAGVSSHPSTQLQAHTAQAAAPSSSPRLVWVTRTGAALQPGGMTDSGEVLTLDLLQGCMQRCVFCSAGRHDGSEDAVKAFTGTAEQVAWELAGGRQRPRAVFLSPTTDPFPPVQEVQTETVRVVEVLARQGIDVWLMTRGHIWPFAQKALAAHADRVRVTVGLTTLDRQLQRILEPLAAPPSLRLEQLADLQRSGVAVRAALEPLIPTVTDTRTNLLAVLEALATVGVRQVTAGFLFLRPRLEAGLLRALEPHGWADLVQEAYAGGPVLQGEGAVPTRYLPKVYRERAYNLLLKLASALGINVTVSAATNPDFTPSQAVVRETRPSLLSLFLAAGRRLARA